MSLLSKKTVLNRHRLGHLAAFGFYGLGVSALFGADVVATKFFQVHDIADWAEVRSLIGLASIFCLIGLEQVLMRSPRSSRRLLRILTIQIPILAIAVGLTITGLGYIERWYHAIPLVAGAAAGLALFQYFRSHRLFIQAQLAQQGWKILAFAAFVAMIVMDHRPDIDLIVAGVVVATAVLSSLAVLLHPPSRLHEQNPEPVRALYAIGSRFMVTSLFLASAIYAEQLLVNGVGTPNDGAVYFTHATYFFFPVSAVNGYLGFVTGPWIRDHHDRFLRFLHRRGALLMIGAGVYAALMSLIGWLAWQVLKPAVGPVDPLLQGLLILSCTATTLYTLPSAYNGVFGRPREHDRLILAQIAAFLAATGLFLILHVWADMRLVHAVGIASAFNWVLRTIIGFRVIALIASKRGAADVAA